MTYNRRERLRRGMRAMLVQAAGVRPGDTSLDVCTGTGEVALALAAAGAHCRPAGAGEVAGDAAGCPGS